MEKSGLLELPDLICVSSGRFTGISLSALQQQQQKSVYMYTYINWLYFYWCKVWIVHAVKIVTQ